MRGNYLSAEFGDSAERRGAAFRREFLGAPSRAAAAAQRDFKECRIAASGFGQPIPLRLLVTPPPRLLRIIPKIRVKKQATAFPEFPEEPRIARCRRTIRSRVPARATILQTLIDHRFPPDRAAIVKLNKHDPLQHARPSFRSCGQHWLQVAGEHRLHFADRAASLRSA